MMKIKPYQRWFWIAGTFVLCGCIHLLYDWFRYSSTLNSAPFSLWVLLNAAAFGFPALICLSIGLILRKRSESRKDDPR